MKEIRALLCEMLIKASLWVRPPGYTPSYIQFVIDVSEGKISIKEDDAKKDHYPTHHFP